VPVPFVDFSLMHAPLKAAILADIEALIDSGAFTNGPDVDAFEAEFASYCGTQDAVGVASGLDALRLSLQATGIGPGDEVVVPAQTFVATAEAVSQTGATPVLADVGECDANLDPEAAAAAVTGRTRAILAVHLYGQMADVHALDAICRRAGIELHEDAAQAHGARRAGASPGVVGRVASFSFYAGKNLGAFGDAGAAATNDAELAERLRMLREHGQGRKYEHDEIGWTARLDSIQAIVLRHKLRMLDVWNAQRRAAADWYAEALDGIGDLRLPEVSDDSEPVWHLYAVRTADPEALAAALRERGVASGRHYPVPVHLTAAYRGLGHAPGAFPNAEAWAREELSMPIFPGITQSQVAVVAEAAASYFRSARAAA
jgi:dTDP-4-amino-4,6-dideoxygalactose transaminase